MKFPIPHLSPLLPTALTLCVTVFANGEKYDYTAKNFSLLPPAPTVQHFFDFKDYPVNNFTGIPTISLPLYTIKHGGIEIPITLSYHGGGIRTNQKSGNAGLGWTISCGAEIAHNVCGAPDDATGKVHGLFHLNEDEKLFRNKLIEKNADYDPTDGDHYVNNFAWQAIQGNRYYEGLSDVGTDTYSLTGLGLSAEFAFTPNQKIVVSSEQPLKIERTNTLPAITDGGCDGYSFLVKDTKGISYYFTTQDRSRYDYLYGSQVLERMKDSLYYASAWHLDKIVDPNGNNVKYLYHKLGKRSYISNSSQLRQYISANEEDKPESHDFYTFSSTVHHPQVLEEILTPGIRVKFHYLFEAYTTQLVPVISMIEIIADDGSTREIKFEYTSDKSLFLTKVIDRDEAVYTFEYDNSGDCSRYNDAQDFGGFNNGIDNSGELVPPFEHFGGTADRSVMPQAAQKNILTKINYPTGGYSQFVWESNVMSHLGRVEFSGDLNPSEDVKEEITDTLRMCLDENYKRLVISGWKFNNGEDATLDLSRYFLMNPANLAGTDYEYSHEYLKSPYNFIQPFNYPHIRFIDTSSTNAKVDLVYFLDKETIEKGPFPIVLSAHLSPGKKYNIELVNPLSVNGAEDFLEDNMRFHDSSAGRIFITRIRYDSQIGSAGQNYWPGLRIKTIVSHTGNPNDNPIRKYYFYNTDRNPNSSIGTVSHLPEYNYKFYRMFPTEGTPGYAGCEINCIGDVAFPSTSSGNSAVVEYPKVTTILSRPNVMEPDGILNSMSESFIYSSLLDKDENYDFNRSQFLSFQPIGSRMYTSRAYRRGNLMSHHVGGQFWNSALTTEYQYNIYENMDAPILTTDAFTVCDFTKAPGINQYTSFDYGIGIYQILPYNKTVRSKKSKEWKGIEQTEEYTYFYNNYTDVWA